MRDRGVILKIDFKKETKRIAVIVLASLLMAANIKSFVRTGELFPGGATGLTLLIQKACDMFFHFELPYTLINLIINAFPVYIGFRFIGFKFTMYSCVTILLTSTLTDIMPSVVITYDPLLISIFGGLINGVVISLCLLVNATTGGTDFIAIYMSRKKNMDSFNLVLGINVVILSIAGLLFGWDKALYSIIFQFASTQVIHTLYKKYQQGTLFIVTTPENAVNICEKIHKVCRHGATILNGEGAHGKDDKKVVYSVISSADKRKVIDAVKEIDQKAFINFIKTEELTGRFNQDYGD